MCTDFNETFGTVAEDAYLLRKNLIYKKIRHDVVAAEVKVNCLTVTTWQDDNFLSQ